MRDRVSKNWRPYSDAEGEIAREHTHNDEQEGKKGHLMTCEWSFPLNGKQKQNGEQSWDM